MKNKLKSYEKNSLMNALKKDHFGMPGINIAPHDMFEWILDNFLKGQQEDKWIDVKNEVPEDRMLPCLVFNESAPIYSQCILQATWFLESKKFKIETTYSVKDYRVTHWQTLPNPPKTK